MIFVRKDKRISKKRFLVNESVGLRSIASAFVRWPIRVWLVGAIVILAVVAGFLAVLQTSTVNAAPESSPPLNCLSCHTKILKGHDKLGSGSEACWVCHSNSDMKILRLADGAQLSLSESPQLCGQCHQVRYGAWKEGTHGIPGTVAAVKCTSCHEPHQPQIAFSDITKPHPLPMPSSPSLPSVNLLIIFGISLFFIVAAGIAVAMRREGV